MACPPKTAKNGTITSLLTPEVTSNLSPERLARIEEAYEHGLAKGTNELYRKQWNYFEKWCADNGLCPKTRRTRHSRRLHDRPCSPSRASNASKRISCHKVIPRRGRPNITHPAPPHPQINERPGPRIPATAKTGRAHRQRQLRLNHRCRSHPQRNTRPKRWPTAARLSTSL